MVFARCPDLTSPGRSYVKSESRCNNGFNSNLSTADCRSGYKILRNKVSIGNASKYCGMFGNVEEVQGRCYKENSGYKGGSQSDIIKCCTGITDANQCKREYCSGSSSCFSIEIGAAKQREDEEAVRLRSDQELARQSTAENRKTTIYNSKPTSLTDLTLDDLATMNVSDIPGVPETVHKVTDQIPIWMILFIILLCVMVAFMMKSSEPKQTLYQQMYPSYRF